MKVIRLNEADDLNTTDASDGVDKRITSWESAEANFLATNSLKDKAKVVTNFLKNNDHHGTANYIESLPADMVVQWADAMKWKELGRSDNEFLKLLDSQGKLPIKNDRLNFIKLYNAYSRELFDNKYLNNSIFTNLVTAHPELYRNDQNDFNYIISCFNRIADENNGNAEKQAAALISGLFEDGEMSNRIKSVYELKNDLNDAARSNSKIKDELNNLSAEDALDAIKSLLNRKDLGENPLTILNKLGMLRAG